MTLFSQVFVARIPNWKVVFEKPSPRHYIMEWVPAGQTLETWTEMITVQGLKDLARQPNLKAESVLGTLAGQIQKVCVPKFIGRSLGNSTIDSFEASRALIGCGELPADHPTGIKKGQGEIGYYIAIKGTNDVYVIHRSMRGAAFEPAALPVSQADLDRWEQELQPIKLCESNVPHAECWARKPR